MQETQNRRTEDEWRRGQESFRPRSPPPLRPPITCFSCGRTGHRAAECAIRKQQRHNERFQRPLREDPGRSKPSPSGNKRETSFPNSQYPDRSWNRQEKEPRDSSRLVDKPAGFERPASGRLSEQDRQALARTAALLRSAGMGISSPSTPSRMPDPQHPN